MSAGAPMVSAPASGHGKTTVTAALARAAGSPVYPLDLWMGGPEHCAALLRP